eukprot:GHVT01103683.1.p1 GENE.GHVT01103683.1~~GHVT01103683.1.p1  ORF type:complete len:158 (+),score=5.98 GHVT01103683.1:369-842(+)
MQIFAATRALPGASNTFLSVLREDLRVALLNNLPISFGTASTFHVSLVEVILGVNPYPTSTNNATSAIDLIKPRRDLTPFPHGSSFFLSTPNDESFTAYLPYFLNCETFGGAIPFWALTEQSARCKLPSLLNNSRRPHHSRLRFKHLPRQQATMINV